MLKILLLLTLQLSFAYGQKTTRLEEVVQKIAKLQKLSPSNFSKKVKSFSKDIEKLLSYRKKVCSGEFSTLVLGDQGSEESSFKKLSKEEIRLCFGQLIDVQKSYITVLYDKRIEYLQFFHHERIKKLQRAKIESIAELTKSNRSLRKTKRKSRRK